MLNKAKKPNHEGAQYEFKVQPKTFKLLERAVPGSFCNAMPTRPE
jgi:hypothetical protein